MFYAFEFVALLLFCWILRAIKVRRVPLSGKNQRQSAVRYWFEIGSLCVALAAMLTLALEGRIELPVKRSQVERSRISDEQAEIMLRCEVRAKAHYERVLGVEMSEHEFDTYLIENEISRLEFSDRFGQTEELLRLRNIVVRRARLNAEER